MKLSLEGIKSPSDWEAAGIALPGYNIEAAARKAQEAPTSGFSSAVLQTGCWKRESWIQPSPVWKLLTMM